MLTGLPARWPLAAGFFIFGIICPMRWLKSLSRILFALLLIEFFDELIFGVREAAWPLIRDDLSLSYLQMGIILSVPGMISSIIEPFIGILGDVWKRRYLIIGGGLVYGIALLLVAVSQNFVGLLFAFILFYPASGAFVSLSQAVLMDSDPKRHEQNMARWTFAGSLGVVIGPIMMSVLSFLRLGWRNLFGVFSILTFFLLIFTMKSRSLQIIPGYKKDENSLSLSTFWMGIRGAWSALKRRQVLRWLILLQFTDLTLDVLFGYLALYFVDVAGVQPYRAGLAVAVWTGTGLIGDFLLIPLLERIRGLSYLRFSAILVLIIFPVFLVVPNWIVKLILIGLLGFLNAGWYAIPKGKLYSSMPDQSGTVITLTNLFGLIGSLMPLGIGIVAQKYGLHIAIWFIILGPIAIIVGIPPVHSQTGSLRSTIMDEE